MLKIAYYTAVDANLSVFSSAYGRMKSEEVELKTWHKRAFSSERARSGLIGYLKEADIFIIQLMGGKESMPDFDRILKACPNTTKVYIYGTTPAAAELGGRYNNIDRDIADLLFIYLSNGGQENLYHMFHFLRSALKGIPAQFNPPVNLPLHGIYHPRHGKFDSLEAYKGHLSPDRPTIGLTFYRNYYINGDHKFVDKMVETLESYDANVIAIFFSTVKNEDIDNPAVPEILRRYFIDADGKPAIDALINLIMFSNSKIGEDCTGYLNALDVPVLQGILCTDNYETWYKENYGLSPSALSLNIALPEIDGVIITVPVATKELVRNKETGVDIVSYIPIDERIDKLSRMALNYAELKHIPNSQKKVAIIMHNYPPKNESIGCAYGLDTQKSIINIINALKADGYRVDREYKDSGELMEALLSACTNHEAWNTEEKTINTQKLTRPEYLDYYGKLHDDVKEAMNREWGEPIGKCMVHAGRDNSEAILIPGIINGNLFIGIQPKRSDFIENANAYHSPDLAMGHHYYGYYQWLKNVFGANAVIHMGKHGSLEWLPGKSAALSFKCHSDIAIDDLPNIYPYIINNPGEGTQAKRRSYACLIGHLEPAMTNADLYDDFADLESRIEEYMNAESFGKIAPKALVEEIEALVDKCGLSNDFGSEPDFNRKLSSIHAYLEEMKDSLINNGLHILGECPEGEDLVHFVSALTRISSKGLPSLREALAAGLGCGLDGLLETRGSESVAEQLRGREISEKLNQVTLDFIRHIINGGDADSFLEENQIGNRKQLSDIAANIRGSLLSRLLKTKMEITNLIGALNGRFVSPGPSGAPTRGQTEILPTGRNFYTLNPYAIPSQAAWKTGVALAEVLLKRYMDESGKYPENIGYVLFGSPTIRTRGEDVAQIMYLMGVRPVWQSGSQNVKQIEVIPIDELKRPRIDVTIRITGFFRDAFHNIVEMLDEAVSLISKLDEPEEMNPVKKHIEADTETLMAEEGADYAESRKRSAYRIFSAKPGAYGTGVNTLINNKNWNNAKDLGDMYVSYGAYAYGNDTFGNQEVKAFRKRLSVIDLAVKNIDTKETDVLANDDNYSYLGGMVAAAGGLSGRNVKGYIGDSSDPARVKVKDIREETRFVVRTKLLNPKWYTALKRHGFKGATDISSTIDYVFGWDATTHVVDDFTYEKITESFLRNEEFLNWMKSVNPWALQNIAERLLEAIKRGMWDADEETKDFILNIYLESEGILEDR